MPRTCLACSSPNREAIDKALAARESFRNVAKQFGLSPAGLFRHKAHIETTNSTPSGQEVITIVGGGEVSEPANRQGNKGQRPLPPAEHRFKPGQSGNPNGRPKSIFSRAVRKHLRQQIAEGVTQLDAVVDAQIQQAIEKRCTQAATFLRDTVDGKPGPVESGNVTVGIAVSVSHCEADDE